MGNLHPLWRYLPQERQNRREMLMFRGRRLIARLQGRKERVILVTTLYVVIWSLPLLFGQTLITFFALLPLLVVPPVGWMVYQLVSREFNG